MIVRLCVELVVTLLDLGGDALVLGLDVVVFECVDEGVTERLRVVVRVSYDVGVEDFESVDVLEIVYDAVDVYVTCGVNV